MIAFVREVNNISARIFLFSVLFIPERNVHMHIRDASRIQTKWILKLFGLIIVNNADRDDGKYVQVSNEKDI